MTYRHTHLRLTANTLERRIRGGVNYLIAPCVAVVSGVLNGEFLPANEIAASVQGWNGVPVPVNHPQRNGEYVSAQLPDVMAREVIGHVEAARFDVDRLKVDLWIDLDKAAALGGKAAEVVRRLEAEQPMEVSTAYTCVVYPGQGVVNGKRYNGVQRGVMPDHIAVLPDEIGACSWRDGCGTPRSNKVQGDHRMEENTEERAAIDPAAGDGQEEAGNAPVESPLADVVTLPDNEAQGTVIEAANAADEPACACEPEQVTAPEYTPNALDGEGWNEVAKLVKENGGPDALRNTLLNLLDLNYLVQEMGGPEAVRGMLETLKANNDAHRGGLIERLTANKACAFDADELAAMPTAQLEKLERSLRQPDYSGRANAAAGRRESAPAYAPLAAPSTYAAAQVN